jgi:hypothetical protein
MLFGPLLDPHPLDLSRGHDVELALYHLSVDAGQAEELQAILRETDGSPSLYRAREMLALHAFCERSDVEELMVVCRDPKSYPGSKHWNARHHVICEELAEALARCGERAVGPLREAALEGGAGLTWFLQALTRISGTGSLQALENLCRKGPPEGCWWEPGARLQSRGYPEDWLETVGEGLASRGSEGREVLEEFAANPRSPLNETARDWLRRLDAGWIPRVLRPPVPPGSLPKQIGIRRPR